MQTTFKTGTTDANEYPSVSCVRYKEFQISLDEGTQEQTD